MLALSVGFEIVGRAAIILGGVTLRVALQVARGGAVVMGHGIQIAARYAADYLDGRLAEPSDAKLLQWSEEAQQIVIERERRGSQRLK